MDALNKHIIIRMELNFSPPARLINFLQQSPAGNAFYEGYESDVASLEPLFNLLRYFILPNLLNQTHQNYTCFIQYNWDIHPFLLKFFESFGRPPAHIRFIASRGGGMKGALKNYIDTGSFDEEDSLMFVKWEPHFVYGLNLIDYLQHFETPDSTKVILFDNGYLYNGTTHQIVKQTLPIFNGMVYLCTPKEHKRYFRVYEQFFLFHYSSFSQFPCITTQEVPYLFLTGEKDFKNLDTLNPILNNQLSQFIKSV
jgi:hypothetical protein